MAKLPALLDLLASFPGVDRKSVELKSRVLREDGLLSRGKRGSGAPDVTSMDAATIVLAHMAESGASCAPDAVRAYRGLTGSTVRGGPGPNPAEQAIAEIAARSETPLQALRDLIEWEGARAGSGEGGTNPHYAFVLDRVAMSVTLQIQPAPDKPRDFLRRAAPPSYQRAWSGDRKAPSEDGVPFMTHTIALRGEALRRIGRLVAPAVPKDSLAPEGEEFEPGSRAYA